MRKLLIITTLAAIAVVAACAPPPPPAPEGYSHMYITRDGADVYMFTPTADGTYVAAAPTNGGHNTRTLLWKTNAPVSVDSSTCATFNSTGWPTQEGVALRVSTNGHPGRAITVMKNIWGYADRVFNVQLIDMSQPESGTRIYPHGIQGVDFSASLGGSPLPWRLCARVIGDQLSYKVFPASGPEPAWTDPVAARTVTLPPGWVYPGTSGVYIGHIPAGGSATFSAVTSSP